jgi:hypothetical protein
MFRVDISFDLYSLLFLYVEQKLAIAISHHIIDNASLC